jgi:spore maturation protein CgeB
LEDLCYKHLRTEFNTKPIKDVLVFKQLVVEELYGMDLQISDVNEAVKVMIGNKLVNDKGIKELVQVLSTFLHREGRSSDTAQAEKQEILEAHTTEGIYYTDEQLDALTPLELAELELQARKPLVMEKYQEYAEDIGAKGLMNMK